MGMIHIYCGNGKGKTTAALGMALRAAGSGMKVHIVQLLKGAYTSELETLSLIPDITIERCDKNYGCIFDKDDENRRNVTIFNNDLLLRAEKLLKSGDIDMLIIDEFNNAYSLRLIDRELADRIVMQKPQDVELILTGRNPDRKFLDIADYVSEIKAVKHPYESGITARKGIEY